MAKDRWESVYKTKDFNEVSWYQEHPKESLETILHIAPDKKASIIDIGCGESFLIDRLLELGYKNIYALDISYKALKKVKKRLGKKAKRVIWIKSDILDFGIDKKFDIWHDRATFHFLISEKDAEKYVKTANKLINPGGYLVISTFSKKGPKRCSGLDVKRYSKNAIKGAFSKFKLIKSFNISHKTPSGAVQNFLYCVFRRLQRYY